MLLRNWEIFDPKIDGSKYPDDAKDYEMRTKGILNKYGELGFVRIVSTQMANDLQGQPIPPLFVPLIARNGLIEWAYTPNVANIKKNDKTGGVSLAKKSLKMMHGEINIDVRKDVDLLYFLLHKSDMITKGILKIDDVREKEAAAVKAKKDAIKLNAAIYSDSSPLSSEATLTQVCQALGILNVDKMTEDSKRIKLEAYVMAEDKKNDPKAMNTDRFLEFINAGETMTRRAIVNKAIQRKLIGWSPRYGWHWTSSNETVVRVPETRVPDKFAYLCEYYTSDANKEAWDKLLRELVEAGYFEDDQPYDEMKYLAGYFGLKIAQKKKKELAEEITEMIKATA